MSGYVGKHLDGCAVETCWGGRGGIDNHRHEPIPCPNGHDDAHHEYRSVQSVIEAEARATALADVRREVERLDTWPRVQWFASRVGANGDFGPGEDRVAVDRSAVLAALDRLAAS